VSRELDTTCRETVHVLLDQAYLSVDADTVRTFRTLLKRPLPPAQNQGAREK
jgi:hypothetical protein